MVCRRFRGQRWLGLASISIVCLALIAGCIFLPPTWFDDQAPSLTPAAHNLPLAAVAETSGTRVEKQAQSHRLFLKKPERTARFSSVERVTGIHRYGFIRHASIGFPWRHLHPPRSQSSSPDDPSDSLLS